MLKYKKIYLRTFDLNNIGINKIELIKKILPSFKKLEWDLNDKKLYKKGPFRKRSISRFKLNRKESIWKIKRVNTGKFYQKVSDARSRSRVFPEMSKDVTDESEFKKLLKTLVRMVEEVKPNIKMLDITCHQVRTVAKYKNSGILSPEGIHQDGSSFIVSALVINTKNITGGRSIISSRDKKTVYFSNKLEIGQGIFQADSGSPLWHHASPIRVKNPNSLGVRDILGFDIIIEK